MTREGPAQPALARRLGTGDAVVVGLSAMIGAGVFAVFAPAGQAAGAGLLIGLAIAALVAFCNAVASTQLAAAYPTSGGTYVYGRAVLGPWWGFVAGWGFVIGKTASCAAMAMTFAAYVTPGSPTMLRAVATVAVVALSAANLRGVTRTALVARALLCLTLVTLVIVLVVTATGATTGTAPGMAYGLDDWQVDGGALGVLRSAGLLFFAFAGYARIATLAEEVRSPATLTRAVLVALGITVVLYTVVAVALLHTLGADLARSPTPVATAAEVAGGAWAEPVVRVGAGAASLGALLALLAGVGRTGLAMARERDLPTWLASVHPVHRVPDHAQLVVGLGVVALVWVADLRGAIGFSSCGVLVYYGVANLAALRQPPSQRRWPRWLHLTGLVGCVVLVVTLPMSSVLGGAAVIAVGVVARWAVLRRRAAPRRSGR